MHAYWEYKVRVQTTCTTLFNYTASLFLYSSLNWDKYDWTGIRDEGAIALADQRVIKNMKTLK